MYSAYRIDQALFYIRVPRLGRTSLPPRSRAHTRSLARSPTSSAPYNDLPHGHCTPQSRAVDSQFRLQGSTTRVQKIGDHLSNAHSVAQPHHRFDQQRETGTIDAIDRRPHRPHTTPLDMRYINNHTSGCTVVPTGIQDHQYNRRTIQR